MNAKIFLVFFGVALISLEFNSPSVAAVTDNADWGVSAIEQNSFANHYNFGNALVRQGEYQSAIASYTQALTMNSYFAPIYHNRGVAHLRSENYQRAIEDFNQAIELDADYASAYNNRCTAYGKLENYGRAIEDCTQAIRLDVEYAAAYYNRGLIYHQSGNEQAAMSDLQQAATLAENQQQFELLARIQRASQRATR